MGAFEKKIGGVTALSCTIFSYLFGEWEIGIQILFLFMILDFISGLWCGYKDKAISSQRGYEGVTKKMMVLVILMVAVALDKLLPQPIFRTLVIYFYVGIEGISITENASKLGVPIPKELIDRLIQLKDGNKKSMKKEENENENSN